MSGGRLAGKVALISGTAQGQGRAAALRFSAEGALVVGGDVNVEAAAETCELVRGVGGTMISPGRLDVTDEASVNAWAEHAVEAFGRIDIAYANAGAVRFGPVDEQSYADWSFTVKAELDSVFLTVRAAWPHLIASQGCIITVGSTAGLTGSVTNQRTAHAATKGGVIALTRQLAAEGARYGIRANCVSPGMIETEGTRRNLLAPDHPMRTIANAIPLGRLGTPADVIPAAVFLASDEAAYITGTNLVIDGGWSMVLPG
ncbi:SDR family NAD(P)-dependent oxidoreductase [Actinoplanes sp. NPDC051851]|uniref:SDR family NAD(P)-dependent oxidoreductase n=1 Tax=Actinoplanes sp. NPDC051851 TaxID=3154753 RepID=UPI0034489130